MVSLGVLSWETHTEFADDGSSFTGWKTSWMASLTAPSRATLEQLCPGLQHVVMEPFVVLGTGELPVLRAGFVLQAIKPLCKRCAECCSSPDGAEGGNLKLKIQFSL